MNGNNGQVYVYDDVIDENNGQVYGYDEVWMRTMAKCMDMIRYGWEQWPSVRI